MKNCLLLFYLLLFSAVKVYSQVVPPYSDDFENGAPGWTVVNNSGSSWELGMPNFGYTSGTHSGNFAWDIDLDSSYLNSTATTLYSPVFDLSNDTNLVLSFWLNYALEPEWDPLQLRYSTDGGITWKGLGGHWWSASIPQVNWFKWNLFGDWGWWTTSNCWAYSSIELDSVYGFSDVRFRFDFYSDVSVVLDGISIDDFSIAQPQGPDAGIASIQSPQLSNPIPFPMPVTLVSNFGDTPLLTLPVGCIITGSSTVLSVYTGLLNPSTADSMLFPFISVPSGVLTICFFTMLPGDINPANDTLCCTMSYNPIGFAEYANPEIEIYPNPAENDFIQINIPGSTSQSTVQLIDARGKIVFNSTIIEALTIEHSFAPGIYLVRIINAGNSYSRKLVVR